MRRPSNASRDLRLTTMFYATLIAPFAEFEFMRRALAGTFALALGAGPVGVFLMLRRMSLMGDAMSHAILPGAAIGFLLSGLSLFDFRDVVVYDGINHPEDAYPSAKPRVAGHLKFIRTCPKGLSTGLG